MGTPQKLVGTRRGTPQKLVGTPQQLVGTSKKIVGTPQQLVVTLLGVTANCPEISGHTCGVRPLIAGN